MVQNRGWGNLWCSFFKQSALLDNIGRCPKFLDSTMYIPNYFTKIQRVLQKHIFNNTHKNNTFVS